MSTVLKAVQELDRRGGPLTSSELPGADGYRSTTWAIALLTLGLVIAVGVIGRRSFEPGATPHAIVNAPAPVVPVPLVVAAPPPAAEVAPPPPPVAVASDLAVRVAASDVPVRPRADGAAPWGRVESAPAEASASSDTRVNVEARPRPRRRPPTARDEIRSAAVSPPPAVIEAPAQEAPTGLGLPRVQVRAIVSGSDPNGRRAVLSIGGGPSVTLHEGESSGGVDVQFITERTVYLRHRGNIFTVGMDR